VANYIQHSTQTHSHTHAYTQTHTLVLQARPKFQDDIFEDHDHRVQDQGQNPNHMIKDKSHDQGQIT